jgi:hypothetical protein
MIAIRSCDGKRIDRCAARSHADVSFAMPAGYRYAATKRWRLSEIELVR